MVKHNIGPWRKNSSLACPHPYLNKEGIIFHLHIK